MRCCSVLASEDNKLNLSGILPDKDCCTRIEVEIDKMDLKLTPLKKFILPGGHIAVSNCQIARCVCRRAERAVIKLNSHEEVPEIVIKFLNRLSDYLFILSRFISLELDIQEIKWMV